jgi:extracellular factor (EF) 3-hydroxypalmitic acid methyl ester biosynthesis protein
VRGANTQPDSKFDFVYCAGLFDYVSDRVCKLLIDTFYEATQPGGAVLLTNVNASRPFRHSMDYLLEWHLVYRDERHMTRLLPVLKPAAQWQVDADETGVNLFLQIRKPIPSP